jgi:TolB-like protein/DNA-binding winged helix-turn-helix (wHTH) protein
MSAPSGGVQARERLTYRVGDLLIDTGRQQVSRGEEEIALPKLSYDLLLALVRAAPNLLSLDELMSEVWPRLVVSPETVSQRVKLLRDALGDDPRNPRYVEGLRGRGYRLLAPVERRFALPEEGPKPESVPIASSTVSPSALDVSPPSTAPPSPAPRIGRRTVTVGLVLLAGALVIAGVAWRLTRGRAVPSSVEVTAVQSRSVAVLPFQSLTPGADNELIALGMADSVLQRLASVPELIVIARASSFALGKPVPRARQAGQMLGAHYLVEGSVQRSGKTLRVAAQLVDATSEREVWSLKLDRPIDEVFAAQDQIAQQVAQQLDVTLQSRAAEYVNYGTDAYLAFLRGRTLLASRRRTDVEASTHEFERAIELAPSFAEAMAELAYAKLVLATLQDEADARNPLWPQIKTLTDRAIAIDPGAGEPYFLRAQYKEEAANDVGGAEADFRRGLDLAPNFGPGLRLFATYLFDRERYEEALAVIDRARQVDPLGAENHYLKGEILRLALHGREEAAALYLQALAVQPDFYPAYERLAQVRYMQGRLAEAIKYGEHAIAIEPNVEWTRDRLVWFYVDVGDLGAARDVLRSFPPGSQAATLNEAVICYRSGHPARAAQLTLSHPLGAAEAEENGLAVRFATDAVVQEAIRQHAPAAARQFILSLPDVRKEGRTLAIHASNFPQVVQLATLERFAGDRALAADLAHRALAFADRGGNVGLSGDEELIRATLLAQLGQDDEALTHLERLVAGGRRIGWWVWLERDPSFAGLRKEPRFQALAGDMSTWLASQVALLARMREAREVPPRAAPESSGQPPSSDGC